MTAAHQELRAKIDAARADGVDEHPTGEYQLDRSPSPEVETAVAADVLGTLNEELRCV